MRANQGQLAIGISRKSGVALRRSSVQSLFGSYVRLGRNTTRLLVLAAEMASEV